MQCFELNNQHLEVTHADFEHIHILAGWNLPLSHFTIQAVEEGTDSPHGMTHKQGLLIVPLPRPRLKQGRQTTVGTADGEGVIRFEIALPYPRRAPVV